MTKKPARKRVPANHLLAATKLDDFAQVRSIVAAWVGALLNDEAGLAQEPVSELDTLRLWGYGSEQAFVRIALKFNTTIRRKRTIDPPDLILGAYGKTVGDLIDFLTRRILHQPIPAQHQPASPTDSNLLANDIVVDLATTGGNLADRIEKFTLDFLRPAYLPVNRGTVLAKFKDGGATLTGLYSAFNDAVQGGDFSGLIDAAKLKLPKGEYDETSSNKKLTVASLINYFLKHARQAPPR